MVLLKPPVTGNQAAKTASNFLVEPGRLHLCFDSVPVKAKVICFPCHRAVGVIHVNVGRKGQPLLCCNVNVVIVSTKSCLLWLCI